MTKSLVIPTNRPDQLANFLRAWRGKGGWDRIYVIFDSPDKKPLLAQGIGYSSYSFHDEVPWGMPLDIYSHEEIKQELGDDAWIISQGDSACRCFGFLKAWWNRDEWVQTLDDDCLPYEPHTNLMERHIAAMTQGTKWVTSVPGTRVRGLPYHNVGKDVLKINYGLWIGYADLDAQTELAGQQPMAQGGFFPPKESHGTWKLPNGTLVPLSGMNLCANQDALPLLYFPLQGKGQPYRRFDDIWAGVIAKSLCDRLGWGIGVGEPFVEHRRASDVRANLEKERPGIEAHETFWEVIDKAAARIPMGGLSNQSAETAIYCVQQLAGNLEDNGWNYVSRLGKALRVWANLLCRKDKMALDA